MGFRRIGIAIFGVALLVAPAACGSSGGTAAPATSAASTEAAISTSSPPSTTSSATSTSSSSAAPSPTTTRTTPTTTSSSYTALVGEHFEGTGDDVITITKPADKAALLTFSCPACESNVAVKTDNDLLVNEIGAYSGTHLIDIRTNEQTTTVEITADSSWTLDTADIAIAPEATSGTGDSVIWVRSGNKVAITHDGQSNFAIEAASASGIDLLVNEIGPYTGTKAIHTPAILDITADGNWTVTPS